MFGTLAVALAALFVAIIGCAACVMHRDSKDHRRTQNPRFGLGAG
jgi:hypothetical protein